MIVRVRGKLEEKKEYSLIVNVQGISYEVLVPVSVMQRVDQSLGPDGHLELVTYHYSQMTPSSGSEVLVGFLNEMEREFFLEFIKVSGIGPRAAVKALNQPISEIAQAIDRGDQAYLKTLPGIGLQRAKDVIAKLQGKVGRFGLIQDRGMVSAPVVLAKDIEQEALEVLLQLQYRRPEAVEMIRKSLERSKDIQTTEDLLNEIYKQRTSK